MGIEEESLSKSKVSGYRGSVSTEERRNGGTEERRNGGTEERRNSGNRGIVGTEE